MKKIFVLLSFFIFANPCFSAVDIKWINTMPYEPYEKQINLEKTSNAIYNKNNIKIEKNVYNFSISSWQASPSLLQLIQSCWYIFCFC